MAYTKTTWAAGDTVTSQKLNKIENQLETLSNGGGAGCFVVNITPDTSGGSAPIKGGSDTKNGNTVYVTDKTYNEIVTAFQGGSLPIGIFHTEDNDGGTRGASTGTSEEWEHWLFVYAAFDADYGVYVVSFFSIISTNGPLAFYTTDPDSTLTTEEPNSGDSAAVA